MSIKGSSSISSRYIENSTRQINNSQRKLASGKRVDKGSDDAAAIAIVSALESDAAKLEVANRNIDYGRSFSDIADSTLSMVGDMKNRMQELAMQSANGTYSDEQRAQMKAEYDALAEEAQRTMETANFNGKNVFSGDMAIQAGVDGSSNSRISVATANISEAISKLSSVDISTQEGATSALDTLSTIETEISSARGEVGVNESRLNVASSNNSSMKVNVETVASKIRDVDVAEESANNVASNIRQNASVAIMAHSNQSANVVQQLLG